MVAQMLDSGKKRDPGNTLPNCWEIMNCGREKGGFLVEEFGECIASKKNLGHSCWAIAGTLCGGMIQGSVAKKIGDCTSCEVHKLYNRSLGTKRVEVALHFPDESERYKEMMLKSSGII